jgi:E3 ubiquitin-protein ligase SIAH1
MEELSRALDETLLKDLECPVCMEYMVPPIKLCSNGHNICSKCRESVTCCPTCRGEFLKTRNVVLENIVRTQKYPCANRQGGCFELFSIEHIAKHHAGCGYGKIKCPYNLIKMCSWNGLKSDLKEHAKAAHAAHIFAEPTFPSPFLSKTVATVSCFGELFTYVRKKKMADIIVLFS